MIQSLASRHNKKLAYLFFLVFYLNLVSPSAARALQKEQYHFYPLGATTKAGLPGNITRPNGSHLDKIRSQEFSLSHTGKEDLAIGMQEKHADIGGPGQPEMSSFKSVNANDMVD